MVFHHIGIATSNIEDTITRYRYMGFETSDIIHDPVQHVNLAFLTKENYPLYELVQPVDNRSPVQNIVSKVGVTPYHMCYLVEDLEEAIAYFKKDKYILIVKPVPAVAFNNQLICFLFHKDTGIVELLQK